MEARTLAVPVLLLSCLASCSAFAVPTLILGLQTLPVMTRTAVLRMNVLSDVGGTLTGDALPPQDSLPYSPPLSSRHSISHAGMKTLAVKEHALSVTGEDLDVFDAETGKPFARVRGAMHHLPGKEKMKIRALEGGDREEVAALNRKLAAITPTVDIYRGGRGAEKVGWIEKEVVVLTDKFDVFVDRRGDSGASKPPPAYRIAGDFLERSWMMKNDRGETVAKVLKEGLFQFDAFKHYQVQIAQGMDVILVLACMCAIDELRWSKKQERSARPYIGG